MCTLTYLPTGKDSFIWTQNRDESPLRTSPGLHKKDGLIFPQEPLSGGTWMAIAQDHRVLSLLNGAFERNKYVLSSKRSRGLVVLDFFERETEDFFSNYDLEGIEPFTMIVYDAGQLWDFRWDKTKRHLKPLDVTKPQIWSSSSLYPQAVKEDRKKWFNSYLEEHTEHTQTTILEFHNNGGTGDAANDLIMDRGLVKTVSITQIVKTNSSLSMEYTDLVNGGKALDAF